jgi:hypothetical protein
MFQSSLIFVLQGAWPKQKNPRRGQAKGGSFILTSLAELFYVARNPVTNRHAVALDPVA